jgi:hypothetical protein
MLCAVHGSFVNQIVGKIGAYFEINVRAVEEIHGAYTKGRAYKLSAL